MASLVRTPGDIGEMIAATFRTSCGPLSKGLYPDGTSYTTPAKLDVFKGDLKTTRNGHKFEGVSATGSVILKHDDAEFESVEARGLVADKTHGGMQLIRCKFGSMKGIEDPDENNGACLKFLREFLIFRTEAFGFIDILHPWGEGDVIESCLHSPYADPSSRHYRGGAAHCDMCQPPGNNPPGWPRMRFQGVAWLCWPFGPGQTAGSTFGNMKVRPTTSGVFNTEFSKCRKTLMMDCHSDGNYSQNTYCIDGDNDPSGAPVGTAIAFNSYRRRRPGYGAVSFMNFGNVPGGTRATVRWGHNIDFDSRKEIPPNYKGSPNGKIVPVLSRDELDDWYKTHPLPPELAGGVISVPDTEPIPSEYLQLTEATRDYVVTSLRTLANDLAAL